MQVVTPGATGLPVRNTFIHFDEREATDALAEELFGENAMRSAPAHMLDQPFQTKWPEHDAKHIRNECKPCAYYWKKTDSCRLGGQCGFCHLCPENAIKLKKKEKVRAMRKILRAQAKLSASQQLSIASSSEEDSSSSSTTTNSRTPQSRKA